ncbi:hypothetical protein BF29_1792 [Heyndrickxia coagulans DSM 1 = ATCC 7050]|uniref:Uncharacterized protein n=1 Tax=Heyndrickxia coagulans DSM 1 = ATCC 7050 TaxID=1121088 RepID=A0A8B4BSG5_HEYCO|nr:hypothetical protein BF29_1792 [Heyndrickxia coagulans DSM 1 = ATCC 7050]SHE97967.1 hypothetical protein SAMN02745208_01205 [Heyndrickxia coagulans DSM 1 = ATCC 7050]
MEVKIQFESVEKSLAKIRSQAHNLNISMDGRGSYPFPSL